MASQCSVEGCTHAAAPRRQWCWGHYWRYRRGRNIDAPLAPRRQTPLQVFREAVARYTEVDPFDEEGHEKAWHRVRVAARRWALAPKPTDPRKGRE